MFKDEERALIVGVLDFDLIDCTVKASIINER